MTLDFVKITSRPADRRRKWSPMLFYPEFKVGGKRNDLMTRGGAFYAFWDDDKGFWITDEEELVNKVDELTYKAREKLGGPEDEVVLMSNFSSGLWAQYKKYIKMLDDKYHELDSRVTFYGADVKKTDYVSKRVSYSLSDTPPTAYNELMSTLYAPEEREKIEWAIGSILAGESKNIQKFVVLYGAAGTGKSTVLNIIQMLFDGYYTMFEAKALAQSNNSFALEPFISNPLVAIQHDGDLSKIEDNTRLNSIVSHEKMLVNEKFKAQYVMRFQSFLFMGTNSPVMITDAKSGITRRLIDVHPTDNKLPYAVYRRVMREIEYELGSIATHCLNVFKERGASYYDSYVPLDMFYATNDFFNFMEDSFDTFAASNSTTLDTAYVMYKTYVDEARVMYPYPKRKFREELKNYFKEFSTRKMVDGTVYRNYYDGFRSEKFNIKTPPKLEKDPISNWLTFAEQNSLFDILAADYPAQYANADGVPLKKWASVTTKLSEIDTSKLHYVRVPENHIVIDFDIKDADGNKSFALNAEAASKWPKTYAELSKSGAGIHLHYIYEGDTTKLNRIYDDNIEIKVFAGNSSLRRKLTKCNDISISKISSGLPLKGDTKLINWEGLKNEKQLRTMVMKNLKKEYHGATKPSVDYIYALLEEAYKSGMHYDLTDLKQSVYIFASNSTHNSAYCKDLWNKMHFASEEQDENVENYTGRYDKIVFFDVEVFPNLFLINWKFEGTAKCVRMINPKPVDVSNLVKYKLVGFNNRRYDNHILYARILGYTELQLYRLSQKIINGNNSSGLFGPAYNLSYADVYDFASKKQSLKKWEIELGIHHKELGLPWDQPVPEDKWEEVAEYCDNDVIATEATFKACAQDFVAREVLASLSGLTVNDTTRMHTTKIIFGDEKHPQLIYTDLKTGEQDPKPRQSCATAEIRTFPDYDFEDGKNMFRGEDVSLGGYVYAEPGMYTNVALLDVASLHPHSMKELDIFDIYTQRFVDILNARIAIKHHDYETAKSLLDGKLAPFLSSDEDADKLAQALKIVINSVYGFTSAKFDNPFRDPRNVNNIVALRGALFMATLKYEVQKRGFTVAHIKTDSIKIPNATIDIIKFCIEFGHKYGYTFEHEATYLKMCLVNKAVYIAAYMPVDKCEELYGYVPGDNRKHFKKHKHPWTSTGTQFLIPYVFKSLFSKEPIEFDDLCETKESKAGSLYLDMNENLGENEHAYKFIGKVGRFCPIVNGGGGGLLMRMQNDKYYAAPGTKGYRWLESEDVRFLKCEDKIDRSYYDTLVNEAVNDISQFGDYEWFVSED